MTVSRSRAKQWLQAILPHTSWLIAAAILLTCVALNPAFQRPYYWVVLARQAIVPAALALILTPIMITGGIDLSVASVAVFSSVVIGFLWSSLHWPIGWAIAGGVAAGGLAGAANGMLILLGVIPLVATLATRELFRGLALTVSGTDPVTGFPPMLQDLWRATFLGVPMPFFGVLLLMALIYFVVHHTWMGRLIFALGDNERATRFAGGPTEKLKMGLYLASGLVAGLCGAALILRFDAAKAEVETSLELLAIGCVVLGGTRVTGGHGHILGTALGIVTLIALQAGLRNLSSNWREMILGVVLVVVAICNETASRLSARLAESEQRVEKP